jgi:anti-anti-sigma regulatory factor/HAMP domain-containing protein
MHQQSREPSADLAIPFWRQFRWHLITAFVLLAVVPVILIEAATNTVSRSGAQAQVFNQLQSVADLKRDQIERWISDSTTALTFLLSRPVSDQLSAFAGMPTPPADEQAQIDRMLSQAITPAGARTEHATRFRSLFLFLPDGRIVAASDAALRGRTVVRQPYFKASQTADYVQPPYYELGSNELVMVITRRLLDSQGQVVAVLGGQLDLAALGEVMLSRSGLGDSGETYLVSQESHYLLSPSRFAGNPLTRAYHSEGIDRALRGENGTGSYANYLNPPVQVMGVYRWVPEVQAALLAETTTSEALAAADQTQRIGILLMLGACLIALLIGLLVATRLASPITALTHVAARITSGDLNQRAEIRQRTEIGVLAAGFNSMTARLQQNVQGLEQRVAERTVELQQALDTQEETLNNLRESISARQTLEQAIRELSSPVLPVLEGVLVMPLIGVIDSTRATLLVTALLSAIEQHHAMIVLMDVTGVPLVDTQVARVLLQAADAARLLGAEPILVGIRPELAQTIVGLGLDLSGLKTQADLQSGIRYAAQRQRYEDIAE